MIGLAGGMASAPARALAQQTENTAVAEALFQEGRKLFKAGNLTEACPRLAESQRLDPATGTLLALALCHEAEQKFASAWAEFSTVQAEARRTGRTDREKLAREHAAALRPKLSTVVVEVPNDVAQTPGLQVLVDGKLMGPGSWGIAMPLDGGEHLIEANAPNRSPWQKTLSLKPASDSARVVVPTLSEAPPDATAGAASAAEGSSSGAGETQGATPGEVVTPAESSSGKGQRIAGLVTAGVGALALGGGGILALVAKSNYEDAKDRCADMVCEQGPYDDSESARKQGNLATALMVGGGVALATGVTLWFLAPRPANASEQGAKGLRIERVRAGIGTLAVEGRF